MANKKILLCDDNQEITRTLEGFFLAKGYDMITSLTGEDALKGVKKQKPDLVIMDLKLPGINGVEVSKKIKENSPSTKVIVLSGFSDEYASELKEIAVDYIMQKPINMKELTQIIADILAGRVIEAKKELKGIPKAKLLIAEPQHTTATSFKEYFSNYESCGGEYDIDLVQDKNELMNKINSFKPDIILLSIGLKDAGKISSDLIDYYDKEDISTIVLSYELDIKRIAKTIKEVCLEKGLVKG